MEEQPAVALACEVAPAGEARHPEIQPGLPPQGTSATHAGNEPPLEHRSEPWPDEHVGLAVRCPPPLGRPLDKMALVGRVKRVQKSAETRLAWIKYCTEEGGGARDPARHEDGFLEAFLLRIGVGVSLVAGDLIQDCTIENIDLERGRVSAVLLDPEAAAQDRPPEMRSMARRKARAQGQAKATAPPQATSGARRLQKAQGRWQPSLRGAVQIGC